MHVHVDAAVANEGRVKLLAVVGGENEHQPHGGAKAIQRIEQAREGHLGAHFALAIFGEQGVHIL